MATCELTCMVMVRDPESGKILVQKRIEDFKGIAFPGGHIENGESIYDGAIREIQEETGYTICNLQSCGVVYWEEENDHKYIVFLFTTTHFSGEMIPETEEGPIFWIDPAELPNMELSSNMDKYMTMFFEEHLECHCTLAGDDWRAEYR